VLGILLSAVLCACGLSLAGERTDSLTSLDASVDATIRTDDGGTTLGDALAVVDGGVDAGPQATSCLDIKKRDPFEVSGKKTIVLPNRGAVTVHCEMQLLGGGFTLIGRASTNINVNEPFGWTSATGTIESDAPYSLDARGLVFSEVLFGEWKPNGPPTNGVIVDVPPDFLTAYATSALDVRSVSSASIELLGPCNNLDFNAPQQMVRHIGFTSTTTHFYMRDLNTLDDYGLLKTKFDLAGNGCARSMDLDDKRGAIWVR